MRSEFRTKTAKRKQIFKIYFDGHNMAKLKTSIIFCMKMNELGSRKIPDSVEQALWSWLNDDSLPGHLFRHIKLIHMWIKLYCTIIHLLLRTIQCHCFISLPATAKKLPLLVRKSSGIFQTTYAVCLKISTWNEPKIEILTLLDLRKIGLRPLNIFCSLLSINFSGIFFNNK